MSMKAWQVTAYGANGNPGDTISKLVLNHDVKIPVAKEGQVVIKVECCAINPLDWKLFSGHMQAMFPLTFPYITCLDVSGTISAVGAGVTSLVVGDKVCTVLSTSYENGGLAQYTVAMADNVSKRKSLTAETAAGLPLAGLTAYYTFGAASKTSGLALGKLTGKGQKLLILGGSTAVGQYAIQLAKNAGLMVTVTCNAKATMPDGSTKADYLKSLGADETIDYKEVDPMTVLTGQGFDHILDAAGSVDDWSKAPGVLKAGGDYVTIANFVSQKSPEDKVYLQHFMLKSCPSSDLDFLVDLVEKGVVKVLIDSVYDFEDAQAAFMKSFEMATKGSGAMGKLVVKVPQ